MSVQMHSMSTNSSFFKPQMTSQSSNYFSSSMPQRQQQNVSQTMRKQKEISSEMEQQGSDKLSALHTRLQLEAEKIRKWKNATETEIREKDKKLQEANVAIDTQRKSVTELQLQKESLSSRLRDEVSNQKEIQQKIGSTRDMCTALKNHAVRLDNAICRGEQDRNTLTHLHQEKMNKFQELLAMFQQLESGQRVWRDSQIQLLTEEKHVSSQLRAECQHLEQKLNKTSKEVNSLGEENREKEELCQKLSREIEEKSSTLDSLQQDKAALYESLASKENELGSLRDEIVLLSQQLAEEQSQLNKTRDAVNNLQETLEQTKATHVEEMSVVQLELSQSQLKARELTESNSSLEQSLEETKCQFSSENDQLNKKLTDTLQQLTLAEEESSYMKDSLSSERRKSEQLKTDKSALQKELAETQLDSEKLAIKLRDEIQQQNKKIEELEVLLVKRGNEYEDSLSEWKSAEAQLQTSASEMIKEKGDLAVKVDTLEQELAKSKSQLLKIEAQFAASKETSERTVVNLTSEKQTANDLIATLKCQTKMLSTDIDELTRQCAIMEQLKSENTKLNKTVQSQHLQVNGLQKELEIIQSDLGSKNGELSGLLDKYKKEANTSQAECVDIKKALESQINELELKYSTSKRELTLLADKYKTEAENAKEEHEQTKSSFNEQVNELVSILEKYRAENQNVLARKDEEIESLQGQLNSSEDDKRANEMEVVACKDRIDLLQTDLLAKNKELKELLGAVECLQSKAKVSATPRQPTRKTASEYITPVHSTSLETDEVVVSSTPKPHSSVAALKKLVSDTPKGSPKRIKESIRSTPHRAYNYKKITSTPLSKNTRPMQFSSSNGNKAKRVRCYSELEAEEMAKFQELYPDTPLDEDEAVFKKPKTTKSIAVRKASSTTAKYSLTGTKYKLTRNTKPKKSEGKKRSEDISWFDSDSVFGLGIDD